METKIITPMKRAKHFFDKLEKLIEIKPLALNGKKPSYNYFTHKNDAGIESDCIKIYELDSDRSMAFAFNYIDVEETVSVTKKIGETITGASMSFDDFKGEFKPFLISLKCMCEANGGLTSNGILAVLEVNYTNNPDFIKNDEDLFKSLIEKCDKLSDEFEGPVTRNNKEAKKLRENIASANSKYKEEYEKSKEHAQLKEANIKLGEAQTNFKRKKKKLKDKYEITEMKAKHESLQFETRNRKLKWKNKIDKIVYGVRKDIRKKVLSTVYKGWEN